MQEVESSNLSGPTIYLLEISLRGKVVRQCARVAGRMATKQQPERQPNSNQGVTFVTPSRFVLMRGIRAFEKPCGIKRFFLSWRDDGRRRAKAFVSDGEREKFARSLQRAREKIGKQALSFDPDEWVQFLRFKDIVGPVDPLTVAREWLAVRHGETDFL